MPSNAYHDDALDPRDLKVREDWRELESLISSPDDQLIVVYEPPHPKHTYYIGADVADGIGQDSFVADVVRGALDHEGQLLAVCVRSLAASLFMNAVLGDPLATSSDREIAARWLDEH